MASCVFLWLLCCEDTPALTSSYNVAATRSSWLTEAMWHACAARCLLPQDAGPLFEAHTPPLYPAIKKPVHRKSILEKLEAGVGSAGPSCL